MKRLLAFILTLVTACGSDGTDGLPGKDGDSSSCLVERKQGKIVVSCLNSDGSRSSAEIAESEVIADCKAQVADLYTVDYHVIAMGEARFASLSAKNLKTSEVFAMTSVIYDETDADFEAATVRLPSFEAKLPGEMKRPGGAWEKMSCD